ncbi:MAG: glycosyltransferase [Pseudomonadota bacterium]
MNLHYVIPQFPELSQTFVFDQMRYLKTQGHELSVGCRKYISHNKHIVSEDFYDHLIIPSSPQSILQDLKFWKKGKSEIKKKRFVGQLALRLIKNNQIPDVIVAHFGPNVLVAVQLKDILQQNLNREIPLIGVFHGYDLSKYLKKNGIQDYIDNASSIDRFVTISQYWETLLVEAGISKQKIKTVRLGVDIPAKKQITSRADASVCSIVSVGRMVEKKGFDDLIEAFGVVAKSHSAVTLELVGDGPLKSQLIQQAKKAGVGDRIKFWGSFSHAQALEKIRSATVFALPSKTASDGDMEGIPVVLMEAMAAAVPVVSTYHSGISELIEDGISGLLVPEHSPSQLAGSIIDLLRDKDKRIRLANAGRKCVEKDYSKSIQNQLFENELKFDGYASPDISP